jgi:hypothetical protein
MDEPNNKRQEGATKQLTTFLAFWYAASGVLLALSVGTVVGVHNGHRLAAFFLLLSVGCFAFGALVQRARHAHL